MYGDFGPAYCECGPNADWFVQEWFHDCIYTRWELAAFWIGMSSVLFWVVAQLPQFISNLKNQSAEALSPWFLLQWLAGDSFNLLGCILTGDQLATQTFTAAYFILADCVIISQYLYYSMSENETMVLEEKDRGSAALLHHPIAGLKESGKDMPSKDEHPEGNSDAHHKGNQYHTFTPVAGRCGPSLIFNNVMHAPVARDSPQYEENPNRGLQKSSSTPIPGSSESGASKGNSFHPNPDEQRHSEAKLSAKANAVHSSTAAAHNQHADQVNRASQTGASASIPQIPEKATCTDKWPPRIPNRQDQTFGKPKRRVEALVGRSGRGIDQLQSTKEQNRQNRRAAAQVGKIPEIAVELLFPSANAMKRHLRRLSNQYGLECGPPSASTLTIHHAHPSKEQKEVEQQLVGAQVGGTLASRLGSGLNKRPVKAAACLASLLTVRSSTKFFQKSVSTGPTQALAVGARRLLEDFSSSSRSGSSISSVTSTVRIGRSLLLICGDAQRPWMLRSVGNCLGWGSSALYFGSRFSQLSMNYRRGSAVGLSLAMLSCAILANSCMGVSILIRAKSLEDLATKAPWLLGSLGTVLLDVLILLQAKYLGARCRKSLRTAPDERSYLLA